MMLTNPNTLWVIAQARQDELLRDVQLRQMQRQLIKPKNRRPKVWQHFRYLLGGSMIAMGHRLQAQQQLK